VSTDHPHREPAPLEKPVERIVRPLNQFVRKQAASGVLLLAAVGVAMFLANSQWSEDYAALKHIHLAVTLGAGSIDMSLRHWVNDGLMVFFFFLLGLEIKRELLAGELRDVRQSSLLFFMASGGMLLPALIYLGVVFLSGAWDEASRGWGIPVATDAAFALGLLALMGSRAPRSLVVLLSGLAILDDIGAVLVIGLFYTEDLAPLPLLYALLCFAVLVLLNLAGVRRVPGYFIGAVAMWWFILQSGVHATTAGVLAALAVPARPHMRTPWFVQQMPRITARFARADEPQSSILGDSEKQGLAERAREVAERTITPLQRWESALERPVLLLIVPIFAFLNAGVALPTDMAGFLESPVALATICGLVLGKVTGISLFAALAVRSGLSRMPEGLMPTHIVGLGMLAGVGFTMSLFIESLAFSSAPQLQASAKLGILAGSLVAALLGVGILLWADARSRGAKQ